MRGWLGVEIQNLTPELAKSLKFNNTDGVLVNARELHYNALNRALDSIDKKYVIGPRVLNCLKEYDPHKIQFSKGKNAIRKVESVLRKNPARRAGKNFKV